MINVIELIKQSKKGVILITPFVRKDEIKYLLSKEDGIFDVKYKSKEEFIKDIHGEITKEARDYLHFNYKYKVELCDILIKNMYAVELKEYNNPKFDELVSFKKELLESNLIEENKLAHNLYDGKDFIVYGYGELDDIFNRYLKQVNVNSIEVIDHSIKYDKDLVVEYHQDEIEEVYSTANKIAKLIDDGIGINNVKIHLPGSVYKPIIESIFSDFRIPINFVETEKLLSYELVSFFVEHLKQQYDNVSTSIINSLEFTKNHYHLRDAQSESIYNELIYVVNYYVKYDMNIADCVDLIEYDLSTKSVSPKKYINCVEVLDLLNNPISEEDYVFIIGFNDGELPHIHRDNDYLTDDEKQLLGINTSIKMNRHKEDNLRKMIDSSKNISISYRVSSIKGEVFKSRFINTLKESYKLTEVEGKFITNDELSYSNKREKIELGKMIDYLNKYGNQHPLMSELEPNHPDIEYRTYTNKFDGINLEDFNQYTNNELSLSYTSINEYYECAFKYYIKRILKVNPPMRIQHILNFGNIFHYVLEKLYSENEFTNVDEKITQLIDSYLIEEDVTLSVHIRKRYEKYLNQIVSLLQEQDKKCKFKVDSLEKEYIIEKELDDFKIRLVGFIDKVLILESESANYVLVIDYKTGKPYIDLNKVPYGLNMQLPVYLYFLRETSNIENIRFGGCMLQPILPKVYDREVGRKYIDIVRDKMKPEGYTNELHYVVSNIDKDYESNSYIKNMRIKKDGSFYSTAKVLDNDKFDRLVDLVSDNINSAIQGITSASFNINPKRIGKQSMDQVSCGFCEYKDICFRTGKDQVYLEPYQKLEFLEVHNNDSEKTE